MIISSVFPYLFWHCADAYLVSGVVWVRTPEGVAHCLNQHTHTHTHTHTNQWRSVPFKLREDNSFFHEHGLISITAYWMTVIHIPFTQLNVTAIGLGYYISQYPS